MTTNASPFDPSPGDVLDGRYLLRELIGEGGTAKVFRAHDLRLERAVAVKALRRASGDAEAVRRARAETRLLASLHHPALVTLFDARIDDDAGGYLVIEYIDGMSLRDLSAIGPVDPGELAEITADIAGALDYVHRAGIVHRAITPGRILLAPAAQRGRVWHAKLFDFGVSHLREAASDDAPEVDARTLAYRAPEAAAGAPATPAADIYSLGLSLEDAAPKTLPDEGRMLLQRMTDIDPERRPSALEILEIASRLAALAPPR
ncbi:serine/threonine-protein kinase [Microbacterium sp. NPDC077184]|uniref:serine/threonine-protein kinase n=1 Tax=Microbacterium sp. NPDC077184 TaxID=3154764 RepID=UPI00341A98ED